MLADSVWFLGVASHHQAYPALLDWLYQAGDDVKAAPWLKRINLHRQPNLTTRVTQAPRLSRFPSPW